MGWRVSDVDPGAAQGRAQSRRGAAAGLWTTVTRRQQPWLASSQEVAAVRYEVGPDGLRARSEQLVQASTRAARLQLGTDVARLRRAMPGARSADAAGLLAREWDDMLCTWTQGATDHARALRRAAGAYDLVEVLNHPRSWTNPLKRGA